MTFTRSSSGRRSPVWLLSSSLLLAACGGDSAPAPELEPEIESAPDVVSDIAPEAPETRGPVPLAGRDWPAPTPWATPIDDYLEAGEVDLGHTDFNRSIEDLIVYEDHLYLGYGDATLNLGRIIPIEIRYFDDPDNATALTDFVTDEEHVESYRAIGDELWSAGIDATEDAWLGNVYLRGPDSPWKKQRTVQNGVHVHDVAPFQGKVYAVGSGATPEEWGAGDIYGHLWVTKDGADTWTIAHRVHNGGSGDARFVRLAPTADGLYVFGYLLGGQGIYEVPNTVWDGSEAALLGADHPLRKAFVAETHPIDADTSLVRGTDATQTTLVWSAWLLRSGDQVTLLDRFADETILDVTPAPETGEWLLLTHDGNDYGQSTSGALTEWFARVYVTSDWITFDLLIGFYTESRPDSLALWRGSLYLGTGDGAIWRATP